MKNIRPAFLALFLVLFFSFTSCANNVGELLTWERGQSNKITPLVSSSSKDLVKKDFVAGNTGQPSYTLYSFFYDFNGQQKLDESSQITISLNYVKAEKDTKLYSDIALSNKKYLVEAISGDCVVKKPFIYPAGEIKNSAVIIMALNPFPEYDKEISDMEKTKLYSLFVSKNIKGNYILEIDKSVTLDKYYCLESDIVKKFSSINN